MNDKKIRLVLVSIAAAHAGRRNSGNLTEKELPIVHDLLEKGLVTLEDDVNPRSIIRNTHWLALTDIGQEKLMELNRLKKQW